MNNDFLSLNDLLKLIIGKDAFHICLYDIAGILKGNMSVDLQYQAHTKSFCMLAKENKGIEKCNACEKRAIAKAKRDLAEFSGYCAFGLYEIVKPVVIDGQVQCVIFVGNMVFDYCMVLRRVFENCKQANKLFSAIASCQVINSNQRYVDIALLLDSYIRLAYEKNLAAQVEAQSVHRIVPILKNYIETNYTQNITLKTASAQFYMDAKYMGRLFCNHFGRTFHEYLNDIRLAKAVDLLKNTDKQIINIALECGFQNVTYFNRIFLKAFKASPSLYRKSYHK